MNQSEFYLIHQDFLNRNQRQILHLILEGRSNQEIVKIRGNTDPSGISTHVRNIAKAFNIQDDYRAHLIILFIRYKPKLVCDQLKEKYGYSPKSYDYKVRDYYQLGGTLSPDCKSYVQREADTQLLELLRQGEYCLVFNPRQTGKSSLKIRTINKLKSDITKCVSVDITLLGGSEAQEARTKGFVAEIFNELDLNIDINSWWQKYQHLTLMQRLDQAMSIVLDTVKDNIVIFIDEIDSIPNADDFFAFIRACDNQRAKKTQYSRLTFCLLGTASPQELMQNKQRTPFNIGREIKLTGFNLIQAEESLLSGLSRTIDYPEIVLEQILYWTKGQPFLTQKLCQLVVKNATNQQIDVNEIVDNYIINNWQQQDSPQHLLTICDRILENPHKKRMLDLYRRILTNPNNNLGNIAGGDCAAVQLILSGLVIARDQHLQVYNPIYREIFNSEWLDFHSSQLSVA